jgi:hypothetical protein
VATLDIFYGDVEVVVFHHVVLTDTHKVKSLPIKRHVMWIVKIEQNKPKIKPGINLIAMEGY